MKSANSPILDPRCIKTHTARVITMLPDLQEFELVQQIIQQLSIKNYGTKPNLIAAAILNSVGRNPNWLVIATIKDMAKDNYNAIASLIGVKLTESIINFK